LERRNPIKGMRGKKKERMTFCPLERKEEKRRRGKRGLAENNYAWYVNKSDD
jgi:hypothetical protein